MAKKNFNSPAMDNLLAGLTSGNEPTSEAATPSAQQEPKVGKSEREEAAKAVRRTTKSEQLSTTVDVEIMNKVRALMEKEGLNKKEVVTAALINLLRSYESTHGELKQKKEKKGKIDVLLGL